MASSHQIAHASQVDPSGWGEYVAGLLGAGTVGLLLREALKLMFARADKNDDNQTVKRGELREQIAELVGRVDTLQGRLDAANERTETLREQVREYRTENTLLRDRYHRLLSYVQVLINRIDVYAERLDIPEQDRPNIPPWIADPVPGPTMRDAMPKPPEPPA